MMQQELCDKIDSLNQEVNGRIIRYRVEVESFCGLKT